MMLDNAMFNIYRTIFLLDLETPMDILSKDGVSADGPLLVRFKNFLGFSQFSQVLSAAGILSAVIIIICSILTLYVANYMKTVAQTKEKIIMALSSVAYIAAFPFIADLILTVIKDAFF